MNIKSAIELVKNLSLETLSSEQISDLHSLQEHVSKLAAKNPLPFKSIMEEAVRNEGSEAYSIHPIVDQDSWNFYHMQRCGQWPANEIDYTNSAAQYHSYSPRIRLLFDEIIGFFNPAEGFIIDSVVKQLQDSKTFEEIGANIQQTANEFVHAETYGNFLTATHPNFEDQHRVFSYIRTLPCIARKGEIMAKYTESNLPAAIRSLAAACSEGIFFVEVFGLIFALKRAHMFPEFIGANESIARDEAGHRDRFCIKARKEGIANYVEQAEAVVRDFAQVSEESVRYLLREPIFGQEADKGYGITIEKMIEFVHHLANTILQLVGLNPIYTDASCPNWMQDLSITRKSNFFEVSETAYKSDSWKDAADWEKVTGLKGKNNAAVVSDPLSVDF